MTVISDATSMVVPSCSQARPCRRADRRWSEGIGEPDAMVTKSNQIRHTQGKVRVPAQPIRSMLVREQEEYALKFETFFNGGGGFDLRIPRKVPVVDDQLFENFRSPQYMRAIANYIHTGWRNKRSRSD